MTDNNQGLAPQFNPGEKKSGHVKTVVVAVLITAIIVGTGSFAFFYWSDNKNTNDNQTAQLSNNASKLNSNSSPTNSNASVANVNAVNQNINAANTNTNANANTNANTAPVITTPKSYSLVAYPLTASPVYAQLSAVCRDDSYWADAKDARLVRAGTDIVIPSLNSIISSYENVTPECSLVTEIFSIPNDGQYLYVKTSRIFGSDAPSSGISAVYRVDLSDFTVTKQPLATGLMTKIDLYRGDASESYKILSDGKRVVKWDIDSVKLLNLETDAVSTLLTVTESEWLISRIVFMMGQSSKYDVSVSDQQAVIGIYDRTRTTTGETITIDAYNNVSVTGNKNYEADILPKLARRVTLSIPK